jgi:N-acyl-D-aspartate/D-glutamate deacylase
VGYDLVFRRATVVDGTGAPPVVADVAVTGGRIAAVGTLGPETDAGRMVEADGLVLAPGFIDIHTHSDVSLFAATAGESKVRQGVTTEVVGNCGFSAYPVDPNRLPLHVEHLEGIQQRPVAPTWTDLTGYGHALEEVRPALNVASLVGHGCLRIAAVGLEREVTPAGLARMSELLEHCMEQGAFGLSTGLTYVPSMYGPTDEVAELARIVAAYDGFYATHARASDALLTPVEEAVEIGRRSGARVQYSHVAINDPREWGRADAVLDVFHRAGEIGIDIAFDVYPYAASSSALTQYLPEWVLAGGIGEMVTRLRDREARRSAVEDLAAGWYGGIPWLWDRVVVCQAPDTAIVGLSLEELARSADVPPAELTLRLCEEHGNEVKVVLFYRTEEDMLKFLADPLAVVGSDGNAIPIDQEGDRPHPRHFGSFPRVLSRYVRESPVLGLAEAVRKMTLAPAERMGITDRGRIAEGLAADLVLYDAERVLDTATFSDPCQAPKGIEFVAVNGTLVIDEGSQTPARPGKHLRRG